MIQALLPRVADALAVLGLVVLTVSVCGIVRMPDVYSRLHAASKAGLMGTCKRVARAGRLRSSSCSSQGIKSWDSTVGSFVALEIVSPVLVHS